MMSPGKVVLLVLACAAISCQLTDSKDAYLIIGLPLQHKSEPVGIWERGEDILLGAQVAVEEINSRSDVLSGLTLHAVEVDIGKCGQQNNHNFLLEFVNFTFHQDFNLIGAVGIFCPTEVQIITRSSHNIMSITIKREYLKSAVKAAYNTKLGKPNPGIVQAIIEVLQILEWRTIAAITNTSDGFFFNYVEKLNEASTHNGSNVNMIIYNYVPNITFIDLPRIILVSVGVQSVTELLCTAYREDLMWPKHVWILHTYHLPEIANLNNNMLCNIEMALENVLLINEDERISIEGPNKYASKLTQYKPESYWYSNALHDLVWSVVLATNESLQEQNLTSPTVGTTLPHRQVKFIQVRNFTAIPIAIYSDQLMFSDPTFIANAPSDTLLRVFEGVTFAYTAVFTIEIVGGFIFVTVMLFGFRFFRQEPEVKSTSFTLSLLMFLGCYLLLVYLSILLYFHQPWATSDQTLDSLCISLNWFSGLGIPSALILVTALVKILRIYYIFSKPSPTALTKRCSDTYLATYVVLIISPMILLHTLWTIVDPYLGFIKISTELDTIQYQKQCKSAYTLLWYSLLAMYFITFFLIVVIIAIKMRKIQKSHFKDTKKLITLVSCSFLDMILTLVCWRILYTAVNAYVAAVVLHIGHFTVIVLSQVLFFAPKIFPPLIRYLKKDQAHEKAFSRTNYNRSTAYTNSEL